jgi:hypothetical protein
LKRSASADEKALLEEIKRIVTNVKRNEREGVVFPAVYDDNSNLQYELKLLSTGGRRQFDTTKVIQRYDSRIAMTTLSDFILLGHEKVGSFALSSNKTDLFSSAIGSWMDMIAGVFNRHAIPRLFSLNNFNITELPQLIHGDIETADLGELGTYVQALANSGAQLFPDERVQKWLHRQAGIPAPAEKPEGSDPLDRETDDTPEETMEPDPELSEPDDE